MGSKLNGTGYVINGICWSTLMNGNDVEYFGYVFISEVRSGDGYTLGHVIVFICNKNKILCVGEFRNSLSMMKCYN